MPDYSNFPPESTDNTPLVYYFPSYYSLQETVTSAKLNSLIRCYNILVEKFMQHNHTGGVNANNENTRAVKLAACACLVDESIFTQCLAHECVTNDKIYDLSYRKIFLSNEPGNEYTLPQKINDMDTDIANRVHLSIDNDIYANNTFYGENIFLSNILFTSDINDLNEHTFDFANIVFNRNIEFNNPIKVNNDVQFNSTTTFVTSPKIPNLNVSTNDDSAANTKFVHDALANGVQVTPSSSNVTFRYKTVRRNGSSDWNSSGYNNDSETDKSKSYQILEFKVGSNTYKIPSLDNNDNTMYVMCHTSCHCHSSCRGGSH